nr:diguanylate cyclase [Pseudomonas sp.]
MCRTGGEEFALICPDGELNDTRLLAEKLRALINTLPFDDIGRVTCSFGVATWIPSESFDAFIRRVDTAMSWQPMAHQLTGLLICRGLRSDAGQPCDLSRSTTTDQSTVIRPAIDEYQRGCSSARECTLWATPWR